MYSSIQKLLVERLPRLGELTFGCEVKWRDEKCLVVAKFPDGNMRVQASYNYKGGYGMILGVDEIDEIIGHKPSHSDILEALGEDWAMTGERKLIRCRGEVGKCLHYTRQNIQLPQNLSDFSLPEYEETRKQLIQLLTK